MLEARLAVSRDGVNISYVDRRAWLPLGAGRARANRSCFFDGAFDAASSAVVRGLAQVGDETILFGWGAQFTHAGLDNWTEAAAARPALRSGLQRLALRRNGFVSLSTPVENSSAPGVLQTISLPRPLHCNLRGGFALELNLVSSIGRGVRLPRPPTVPHSLAHRMIFCYIQQFHTRRL